MTDERALISRAKRGDMEAFRLLVEQSRLNVYRLAYDLTSNNQDAEDIMQEVFIKAYRSVGKFRGDAAWGTWLYRITVNISHDRYRSGKREAMSYKGGEIVNKTGYEEGQRRSASDPDKAAESALIKEDIERAMNRLSRGERSVFVLRHYHDLRLKQIAETLELKTGTVKTLLHRAVQKLQQDLAFYQNESGLRG